MIHQIILRGPKGSGKSAIGLYLREVSEGSILLDLDLNANGLFQDTNEVLGKKNIIAELYHGNSLHQIFILRVIPQILPQEKEQLYQDLKGE